MTIGRWEPITVPVTIKIVDGFMFEIWMPEYRGRNHPPGPDQMVKCSHFHGPGSHGKHQALEWVKRWANDKGVNVNFIYLDLRTKETPDEEDPDHLSERPR